MQDFKLFYSFWIAVPSQENVGNISAALLRKDFSYAVYNDCACYEHTKSYFLVSVKHYFVRGQRRRKVGDLIIPLDSSELQQCLHCKLLPPVSILESIF